MTGGGKMVEWGGGGAPWGLGGGLWPPSYIVKKCPVLYVLQKRSLILDQLAADSFEEECSVLNITLLVGPTAF